MNILSLRKTIILGVAAASMALATSCAKEVSTDTSNMAREFIEAWMKVNHPEAKAQGLGVYIIDDKPGTGPLVTEDDMYLYTEFTTYDIDGNITGTTVEEVSQQAGGYSKANYYGPKMIINLRDYTEAGVLEMIKGMRVGGTRTAVIPSWLNVKSDYDSAEKYLKANGGSNAICTLTLKDKTTDIVKWELDTLTRFVSQKLKMSPSDSLMNGFYIKTLKEPDDTSYYGTDSLFCVNYTGRLLNGKVFDTTIEDTAKVHGIWSSSKTYAPVYIQKANDYKETTMAADETSTGDKSIDGFSLCLSKLRQHEKVICAFYSILGYGYSGQGNSIPSFCPLVFEIEAVDK